MRILNGKKDLIPLEVLIPAPSLKIQAISWFCFVLFFLSEIVMSQKIYL